jgi:hypothetical protein
MANTVMEARGMVSKESPEAERAAATAPEPLIAASPAAAGQPAPA